MHKLQKIMLLSLAAYLCLILIAEAAESVKYIDENGTEQTIDATAFTTDTTSLQAGWHYVKAGETVTINGDIFLSGNGTVNLILGNGATLTAMGINYNDGITAPLVIYSQGTGDNAGTLNITSSNDLAYIYGSSSVTINGGIINITNSSSDAYIYGEGDIAINGGTVNVTGKGTDSETYIYGKGDVTINGGQVTVTTNAPNIGINCWSDGSITLGYTNNTDFILAPGYYSYDPVNDSYTAIIPAIATGKTLAVMSGDTLEKVIDSDSALTASELDGKKLIPVTTANFDSGNGGSCNSGLGAYALILAAFMLTMIMHYE